MKTYWGKIMAWVAVASVGLLIGAAVWGWIANIVAIAHSAAEWTPMFVLRCIGIIAWPLGCVLGFVS